MIDWNEILKTIGVAGILTGAVTFIGKSIINLFFKNSEESFKHSLNIELEETKSRLSIEQIKASKLHDRRLNVIADLYQRIVPLYRDMLEMTNDFKVVHRDYEEEEIERIKNTALSYNEFNSFYSSNKIFFSKETCDLIESLRELFHKSYNAYTFRKRWNLPESQNNASKAIEAFNIIKEKVPPILDKLELDFRNDIGLNK